MEKTEEVGPKERLRKVLDRLGLDAKQRAHAEAGILLLSDEEAASHASDLEDVLVKLPAAVAALEEAIDEQLLKRLSSEQRAELGLEPSEGSGNDQT